MVGNPLISAAQICQYITALLYNFFCLDRYCRYCISVRYLLCHSQPITGAVIMAAIVSERTTYQDAWNRTQILFSTPESTILLVLFKWTKDSDEVWDETCLHTLRIYLIPLARLFLTTRSDNLKLRHRGSLKQQWLLIVTKMADIDVKFFPICRGKRSNFLWLNKR